MRNATLAVVIVLSMLAAPLAARAYPDDPFKVARDAFVKREYEKARSKLGDVVKADAGDGRAQTLLALIAFYYGDDKTTRERLDLALADEKRLAGEDPDLGGWLELAKGLGVALEGPFQEKYGADASKLTGKTKAGHYLLQTDCGAKDLEKIPASGHTKAHEEVAALLEKIFDAYSTVFPGERDKRLLSRAIVFQDREDYQKFVSRISPGDDGTDSAGQYQPAYRLLLICNDKGGATRGVLFEDSQDTMFHEGFHQFLDYFIADAPIWFNEGIAEYFGPSEIMSGMKLRIGVVVKAREGTETRYQVIRAALAGKGDARVTPLRELINMDSDEFMKDAGIHYAESWSFIHYLMHGASGGKELLSKYFLALKAGKNQKAAFDETFGKVDLEKMEKDWKKYVEGL